MLSRVAKQVALRYQRFQRDLLGHHLEEFQRYHYGKMEKIFHDIIL